LLFVREGSRPPSPRIEKRDRAVDAAAPAAARELAGPLTLVSASDVRCQGGAPARSVDSRRNARRTLEDGQWYTGC